MLNLADEEPKVRAETGKKAKQPAPQKKSESNDRKGKVQTQAPAVKKEQKEEKAETPVEKPEEKKEEKKEQEAVAQPKVDLSKAPKSGAGKIWFCAFLCGCGACAIHFYPQIKGLVTTLLK